MVLRVVIKKSFSHLFMIFIVALMFFQGILPVIGANNYLTNPVENDFPSNVKKVLENKMSLTAVNYQFIWNEFENIPTENKTNQIGDDSVYWGPDLGPYYNYTEMLNKIKWAASNFSELVSWFYIGKSTLNQDMVVVKITNNTIDDAGKKALLIVANHDGRDAMTSMTAMYLMDRIIFYYFLEQELMSKIFKEKIIYIIPSINPDVYKYIYINPWIQKNLRSIDDDGDGVLIDENETQDVDGNYHVDRYYRTVLGEYLFLGYEGYNLDGDQHLGEELIGEDLPGGVRLNRNYPVGWNSTSEKTWDKSSHVYAGEKPFSESETIALKNFVESRLDQFYLAIDLYTGFEAVVSPYIYKTALTKDETQLEYINTVFSTSSGIPSLSSSLLGYQGGTFVDWIYEEKGIYSLMVGMYNGELINASAGGYNIMRGVWDKYNCPADELMSRSSKIFSAVINLLQEDPAKLYNHAPEIKYLYPDGFEVFTKEIVNITWVVTDQENDTITIDLYYSPNNGKDWFEIASNLENNGKYYWNISSLENGAKYRIKLIAFDGLLTSEHVSRATFSIQIIEEATENQTLLWKIVSSPVTITSVLLLFGLSIIGTFVVLKRKKLVT